MDTSANYRRTFPWRRLVLLLVVCFLAGRSLWRFPRTNWSLTDSQLTAQVTAEVQRAMESPPEIRRVLVISIDTCRADHFGCYGYSRDTSPNIDRLAGESLLFRHAIAPVPLTLPSHCSMLTGRTPLQHHVHDNENYRLADSQVTLAETLKREGFKTGAIIGAFPLDSQFGLDQGFDTYDDDIGKSTPGMSPHDLQRTAQEVSDRAERWLEKHQREDFFLFLHYFDLHAPYHWHPESDVKIPLLYPSEVDRYDSEIRYTDYHVGRVIDSLKRKGIYDSTLIILAGDHGESLGARHEHWHGFFVYHDTVHVPLIVKLPGCSAPATLGHVASLVDIVPTVGEWLGIETAAGLEGNDLLSSLRDQSPPAQDRAVYCESLTPTKYGCEPLLSLVTNRYKYIRTKRPELYDLQTDPAETTNVILDHPGIAKTLASQLEARLPDTDQDSTESRIELDNESLRILKSLGYIGGDVDSDLTGNAGKDDPKDLIKFHQQRVDAYDLVLTKDYVKAKALVQRSLSQKPDFFEPFMRHLSHVLATDPNPRIRDPEAALAIAECGAKATEFRDPAILFVLQESYEALGRHQEATEIGALFDRIQNAHKETPDAH